jgi:L-amino acid N-acyltransferase YncA
MIRPFERRDVTAIAAIYAPFVTGTTITFELEPPDAGEMLRRCEAIVAGGHPFLVAEQAGHVVGYAYATSFRARPAYRHTIEHSIYIAPTAQKAGLGRRLLQALLLECEARGFKEVIAVITDDGDPLSQRFHASLGFAMVGRLRAVGFKLGRDVDVVLMQRSLRAR